MTEPDLTTPGGRLKWARQRYFPSARKAADALGMSSSTYQSHEDGSRKGTGLKADEAKRYAQRFRVSYLWLLTGKGDPHGGPSGEEPMVKVSGNVGAGAAIIPLGHGEEWYCQVDNPTDLSEKYEIFEVYGNSMLPIYGPGDLLFVDTTRTDPRDLLNRACLVTLDTGERFVKVLKRGSQPGLYDLESWNAEPMQDRRVVAAGRIAWFRAK